VQTGAIGVVAATALARMNRTNELAAFARRLLKQGLVPGEMLPALARMAWTAGLAQEAGDRLEREPVPWRDAARLELAILSGDRERAAARASAAGSLAEPCRGLLALLSGARRRCGIKESIAPGRSIEVWRTHPVRWNPWIEAVKRSGAHVRVADLARGVLPAEGDAPDLVMDDGALLELVDPAAVTARRLVGDGVWVDKVLCEGIGIGHDLPESERHALVRATRRAVAREAACIRVVSAEAAIADAATGKREIVLAPPGDPFWAGPLPERAWPAMHVVRADPDTGWNGMGARIATLASEMAGR